MAKIRSNFTFGNEVAESDPLLSTSYFDNGDYQAIETIEDPRRFIIGRTGSGKTALFAYLKANHADHVVQIKPERLALRYLTNLNVLQKLRAVNAPLDPFFRALWKHVIVVEVLRHRYSIYSPEDKQSAMKSLMDRLRRDQGRRRAIEYLDQFGERFWDEADERIKEITEKLERKVTTEGGLEAEVLGISMSASGEVEHLHAREATSEVSEKLRRIIDEPQLAHLDKIIDILDDTVLDDAQHRVYLVIDDLDKNWIEGDLANLLIRCLLEVVMEMQQIRHLKVLVALRSNIFQQLGFGDLRRGAQVEKFHALVHEIRWTRDDLIYLLDTRAEMASHAHQIEPKRTLSNLLPPRNESRGAAIDHILRRTHMRPRDTIVFLNACVREASGKARINWEHIERAERSYSENRLDALRDEWKDPFFRIELVLDQFRRRPAHLSHDELADVLDAVALLADDPLFDGRAWLAPLSDRALKAKPGRATWVERYGDLATFLCDIGFLGIVKSDRDDPEYSNTSMSSVDHADIEDAVAFEVHPAYRIALNMLTTDPALA